MQTTVPAPKASPGASVCAVVVTYNRSRLLQNCLSALQHQSRAPNQIIVVDNASTDDTREVVRREFPDVTLIALPENTGGAGGFHAGMLRARELGHDYVWVMDDDGLPAESALERLEAWVDDFDLVSPLVADCENGSRLAFGLKHQGRYVTSIAELDSLPYVRDQANLFNGALISSRLLSRVGYPNPQFFIRGDERDFLFRCLRGKERVATVTDALFYHPADGADLHSLGHSRLSVYYSANSRKNYLVYRNQAYLSLRYIGLYRILLDAGLYCAFFLVVRRVDLSGLLRWCLATARGIIGDFKTPAPARSA